MPVTAIEVIDTAVKIGLGGAITVAGTLVITKLNHKHDNGKERAKRYFDALESVGENIEEITHTALCYWALVIEWVRNNKQKVGVPVLPTKRWVSQFCCPSSGFLPVLDFSPQ